MSVSVLNNLGAMSAMAAATPLSGGLTNVGENASSAGLFSMLFSQQLDSNTNPLLVNLIAENPSAAPQLIKNALHLDNNKDSKTDLSALFAMISPDVNDILAQIAPNIENRNDLALSTLNNLLSKGGSDTSSNSSSALLNALMAQANKSQSAVLPESVKLAANDETIETPFNHILATIEAGSQPKATQTATVAAPVGSAHWAEEFNQQIVWAAKNDWQSAEIRLHPENMGPIKISLNITDGKAQIAFVAAHSEVRQSIQEALPQLKEMLATSGIDLGQTNVGGEEKSPNFQDFSAQAQKQSGILSEEATFEETAQSLMSGTEHVPLKVLKADSSAVDLFA